MCQTDQHYATLVSYLTSHFTFSNVFVDLNTSRITSIIDWQHAVIVPLSFIARHPKMFQHSPPASLETLEPGTQSLGYAKMNP
ncbi:phosphotransferase enzyme [Penicillium expansum]|nr:phosphotransferase enzyme [Penicillium expansum]